jgi:hypothetical protein
MSPREQIALGDYLNKQIDVWREKQGLPPFTNAHLKTNIDDADIVDAVRRLNALSATLKAGARGDDDDSRQIIADLISSNNSPFTPDDEMALRHMSSASLNEMRKRFLKRKAAAVANSSGDPAAAEAMSANVGIAGADFHKRAAERKRLSDAYNARNQIQRQRAVTNADNDDAAVKAMSENIGAVEYLRRKGGK